MFKVHVLLTTMFFVLLQKELIKQGTTLICQRPIGLPYITVLYYIIFLSWLNIDYGLFYRCFSMYPPMFISRLFMKQLIFAFMYRCLKA